MLCLPQLSSFGQVPGRVRPSKGPMEVLADPEKELVVQRNWQITRTSAIPSKNGFRLSQNDLTYSKKFPLWMKDGLS